ncbi:hypothetical protein IF1G_01790 [Cordyceps javanica]|uniref:Uncharacterized protein n=1 Tax=Cordyceps javanica TaxID=43265 RepID=A0A545VCX1_9HYPO|nr:hypothetical protein IF1G_01790 [Cordyceps javanica]
MGKGDSHDVTNGGYTKFTHTHCRKPSWRKRQRIRRLHGLLPAGPSLQSLGRQSRRS